MWRERVRYDGCERIVAAEDHQFDFNFTNEDAAANKWQLIDSSDGSPHQFLRGQIFVRRGDTDQPSDLEVRVSVKASDKADLNNVHFRRSDSALDIDYSLKNTNDSCTEITIFLLIRPWPKRFLDSFKIHTDALDIDFDSQLNWEINHLTINMPHGDMWSDSHQPYVDPLIAHNISISSIDGLIFGWFIPGQHIAIRNENGGIGGWIAPMIDQDFPFDPKSISVSTTDGIIKMGFVGEIWPDQALTHRWDVQSVRGNITAGVPHGAYTNVSSISGNLETTVWTFAVPRPNATSEIYTSTKTGNNYVQVLGPPRVLHENYNSPLFNTYSVHDVAEGDLWVAYPSLWWGEMKGEVGEGGLRFRGNSLEYLEHLGRYVKAIRGKLGESQLYAHVDSGLMTVQLGT